MIYTFSRYELDDQLYELRHAGEVIKLEPKAFDMLTYLIEQWPRVVTKRELRQRLWPVEYVSDDALVRCVVQARKAVADDGVRQQVIKTVHRRGYQFVAPVKAHNRQTTAEVLARTMYASP